MALAGLASLNKGSGAVHIHLTFLRKTRQRIPPAEQGYVVAEWGRRQETYCHTLGPTGAVPSFGLPAVDASSPLLSLNSIKTCSNIAAATTQLRICTKVLLASSK